jgi:predicted DNA-binding protein (UPF0251 family)
LPSAEPAVVDCLESSQVLETLQSLEETFRAPLALFYLQEHSYEEIADILEVPIGTVMSRLSRGKAKLQQALVKRRALEENKIIPLRDPKGGPIPWIGTRPSFCCKPAARTARTTAFPPLPRRWRWPRAIRN